MKIEPKVRGFLCTTAHPKGCRESVRRQIAVARAAAPAVGPKHALVIGASTGYGLASRIALAYTCGADTMGVQLERPASLKRTATAGWYNTQAFSEFAKEDGRYAKTFNIDAFSNEAKQQVIEQIRQDFGQVDMVVYSLAAPRRTMPDGTVYQSVLKTVGQPFQNKTLDLRTGEVATAEISPASQEEIVATVKVMGGEDWEAWIHALSEAGVLADDAVTLAYSYIGPQLTYPVYHEGTIGQAKKHLKETADRLCADYAKNGLRAMISVNKALVTQASAAIPIVPLYISILYRVMKEKGLHEGCIEQMVRLFGQKLYPAAQADESGFIRLDDYEMREEVQREVMRRWEMITTETVSELADTEGYWEDFYHMFGFHYENVDYEEDILLEEESK